MRDTMSDSYRTGQMMSRGDIGEGRANYGVKIVIKKHQRKVNEELGKSTSEIFRENKMMLWRKVKSLEIKWNSS